ncbi:sensor domain-containing diguanylate cyclase [Thauera sinica]|uniref:Diguanylate cyclase domain-containing protein n=1 Tax=Thauera sinica TaxID=2665146 RepID=A0ABW1ALW0_9RHOO|nr:sensor domain-containing diguanylate cyclase [Thauera sp. K11]ATE60869.1 sensor domain-containing diguanylate cyclase [Thauera sp. K11]
MDRPGLSLLRKVAEGVHGVEALLDAGGRLLWISPSIERVTGRSPAQCLAAADAIELLVVDTDRNHCRRLLAQVLQDGATRDVELRFTRADGAVVWVASHWRRVDGENGEPAVLQLSAEDIQTRKETEYKLLETVAELRRAQALREHYLVRSIDERQRLAVLLNLIRLGILFIDNDRRVLYANRAMLEIWGYSPDTNLIGTREAVLKQTVLPLLAEPDVFLAHLEQVLENRLPVSEPFEIRFRDGRTVTDRSAVVVGGQRAHGIGRVWIYEDITESRRVSEQLVALAERDPLTNLYNRRRFHEELERMLVDAVRRNAGVGLVALDLDGFKPINDAFGHQAGDAVLVGLAEGVRRIIRRNEMFFRLGGDEFALLVPDTDTRGLSELAARLREGVAGLQFSFGGRAVSVTASIGMAIFPDHADDAEGLMAAADEAMYRSKSEGRNRWTFSTRQPGEFSRHSG